MTQYYTYPAWLEAYSVADSHMASAYEMIDGRKKSAIKETIALLHVLWGERPGYAERVRVYSDFSVQEHESPATFALVLVAGGYARATPFLATLMPALLAGVERILPCFLPDQEALPNPDLLAVLDLAGVEKAFMVTPQSFLTLVREMRDNLGDGRLICLSESGETRELSDLSAWAVAQGLTCMNLLGEASYHPQEAAFSACAQDGERPDSRPLLTLGPNYEHVWVWPQLSPSWFCTKRMHIFSS